MKKYNVDNRVGGAVLRAEALEFYYRNPNLCKNCGKVIEVKEGVRVAETLRKTFCSGRCATIYNSSKCFNCERSFKIIINIYSECTNCFKNKIKV